MSDGNHSKPTRRGLLAAMGLAAGAAMESRLAYAATAPATQPASSSAGSRLEPFFGDHQSGILTPQQAHTYFAAFDLTTDKRQDVIDLLRRWTTASAKLMAGQNVDVAPPIDPAYQSGDSAPPPADSGEALGMPPSRLTITFGFGAGLFSKNGKDRFGLAARRPEALVDMPRFSGDQLQETRSGGDLSIQACADDPQVAFHAVRQLAKLAYGAAEMRWVQTGFLPQYGDGQTPRNLMGFKDGTRNPSTADPALMDKCVWVGNEGPQWMRGGSFLVVRRIRIALEHWDRMSLAFQEQTIGRHKNSGAPLGEKMEFDAPRFDAADKDGNSLIPDTSHLRLAAPENNDGIQILRRGYSYNDGVNFTSERWPPWRQGMEYDAGLLFLAYQRDPRTGFIKIFEPMAKMDMLNQFVTHTGGGLFACPPGIRENEYIGQGLFA